MCNAWNHHAGCACGFGPPYPGTITFVESCAWVHSIPWNIHSLRNGLRESGVDEREVTNAVQRYRSAGYPMDGDAWLRLPKAEQRAVVSRLRQVLRLERHKVDSFIVDRVRIPLFLLHCPDGPRCRVSYRESTGQRRARGWYITIPGVGMGTTHSLIVEFSAEFCAEEGECKLIFVPLLFRYSKVGVYKKGRRLRHYLRTEVLPPREQGALRKGAEEYPKKHVLETLRRVGRARSVFHLSRENPTSLARYTDTWTTEDELEYRIAVEALGLKALAQACIRCQHTVRLRYELSGGRNYQLFSLEPRRRILQSHPAGLYAGGHGILWKTIAATQ